MDGLPHRWFPAFPIAWEGRELDPDVRLLVLSGELDLRTAPVVADALTRPVFTDVRRLVIDLSGVRFLGAAGSTSCWEPPGPVASPTRT